MTLFTVWRAGVCRFGFSLVLLGKQTESVDLQRVACCFTKSSLF